jgi:amidohydrolase
VVAAEYNDEMVALAREAIITVLGEQGLLAPIVTPGGDDFHFYAQHKPSLKVGFVGLGCNLLPGLHHPEMSFDHSALPNGIRILSYMVEKIVGYGRPQA